MEINNLNEIAVLIGVFTPFVTAIVAKMQTPDWWKGLLSITFAAVGGIVATYKNLPAGAEMDWAEAFGAGATVWATHLLTWLGISATAVKAMNTATKDFGLGAPNIPFQITAKPPADQP